MDEFQRDRISNRFAELTAFLEDAVGLAVECQSSQRSLASIRENTTQIRSLLIAGVAELAPIERGIGTQGATRNP